MACFLCHGPALVATGGAPDLRESQLALNPNGLWSVLHDGALIRAGMPRFDSLTQPQVMQIWAYIRQRARDAKAEIETKTR